MTVYNLAKRVHSEFKLNLIYTQRQVACISAPRLGTPSRMSCIETVILNAFRLFVGDEAGLRKRPERRASFLLSI